jgi:mediator of RNA polymerase II transcription subunit 8
MESRMNLHEAKANALTNEAAAKQVAQYTKIVSHVYDLIAKAREDWEIDSMNRNMQMSTFSLQDTQVRAHWYEKFIIFTIFLLI